MNTTEKYAGYVALMQKIADLNNAAALLAWDQETYMPPKSASFRARQLATLSTMAHELNTGTEMEALLQDLKSASDLDPVAAANILRTSEDYEKNKKLPHAFVEQLSMQTSESFNAWIEARRKNDFSIFAPSLAKMVDLKRQQADLYGYTGHPYNALADEYEPGITTTILDKVFDGLKKDLPPILNAIRAAKQVDDAFMYRHYPHQEQWNFSLDVLKTMGYDLEAGRQDLSEHPFTTSFAPTDVRVTTRVDENNFASLLWSSIHEGGHALYEQGLPESQYGLPLGAAASLGIHESQSRLWENCVGRGIPFWTWFFPILQKQFPTQLSDVSITQFVAAANKVEPSLIRTEADEITYHFHVIIRYEIEKALIAGEIEVRDLPALWNEQYNKYLGITPPDHKSGVLQDVHWSHGSFGYFPTYSLGSMYAAQFYAHAGTQIPGLATQIAQGNTTQLLSWLRTNIHVHGRRYYSEDLCRLVTGKPLDASEFINYIKHKYAGIYDIKL